MSPPTKKSTTAVTSGQNGNSRGNTTRAVIGSNPEGGMHHHSNRNNVSPLYDDDDDHATAYNRSSNGSASRQHHIRAGSDANTADNDGIVRVAAAKHRRMSRVGKQPFHSHSSSSSYTPPASIPAVKREVGFRCIIIVLLAVGAVELAVGDHVLRHKRRQGGQSASIRVQKRSRGVSGISGTINQEIMEQRTPGEHSALLNKHSSIKDDNIIIDRKDTTAKKDNTEPTMQQAGTDKKEKQLYNSASFSNNNNKNNNAADNNDVDKKAPFISILEKAGVNVTHEMMANFPPYSDVIKLYGNTPIIIGLDRCEAFRNNVSVIDAYIGGAG